MKRALLIEVILATVLVALFAIAAGMQLSDFAEFKRKLFGQVFTRGFATFLLYFIPGGLLSTISLLCWPKTRLAGFGISCFLMLLFTGYAGLVVLGYYSRVPCSCISLVKGMSFGGQFYFNLFFTAVAAIGFIFTLRERRLAVWAR